MHQHRQAPLQPEALQVRRRPVPRPRPGGDVSPLPGPGRRGQRTQEIADSIDIELDFKKRHFPVFTPPAGKTEEQHLRELCEAGLLERYQGNPSPAARQRLEHELGIICRMGFASYFLIVWDFVRFARENGIPAGARGSACGALVSYVLKLSHVDPLEYDLLFERFLDPNRAEAPDIDIDFCQEGGKQVIAYVKQKYGEQSVAQIATFGTMAAKAGAQGRGPCPRRAAGPGQPADRLGAQGTERHPRRRPQAEHRVQGGL